MSPIFKLKIDFYVRHHPDRNKLQEEVDTLFTVPSLQPREVLAAWNRTISPLYDEINRVSRTHSQLQLICALTRPHHSAHLLLVYTGSFA